MQIYQKLYLKNKLSKQEEQRQNPGDGDGCQMGGVEERVKRIKKYKEVVTE